MSWRDAVPAVLSDDDGLWEPCYGTFDRTRTLDQLASLARLPGADDAVLEQAAAEVAEVFDQWERTELDPSWRPSFAFLAPSRVKRGDPSHVAEALELCPALRACPDLSPLFMAGIPPFAIDRYGTTDRAGICLYAPVLADMATDLPVATALATFESVLRTTLAFARDLGAEVAGLAGTLPALTDFGRSVCTPGLATTTGHAGTSAIIIDLVDRLADRGATHVGRRPWGLIGCGSIGSAVAHAMAARHPDWSVLVADDRADHRIRTATDLRRGGTTVDIAGTAQVLESCDLVISAVTSPIDLDHLGVGSLDQTVVIDDSQPSCFDREALHRRGARLFWPLALDTSTSGFATRTGLGGRTGFTYGGLPIGVATPANLFGCEAEVATIAQTARPDLALARAVRPADVEAITALFDAVGIRSAPIEHCER